MRDGQSGEIAGIAGQVLFFRRPKSHKRVHENSKRRDPHPRREAVVWGQLIDQIGAAPAGVRWIHVCDRGADDYELFCRSHGNGCGWVVRAARLSRLVYTIAGDGGTLEDHLASQPVLGHSAVEVPRQGSRTVEVTIRAASLRMPSPWIANFWIRQHRPEDPLLMWVVQLQEKHPDQNAAALHWVLLTSEPVTTIAEAQQVLGYDTACVDG